MIRNDDTLSEVERLALVRAYFADDMAATELVRRFLTHPDSRARTLALRAALRQGWLSTSQWRTALADASPVVRREAANLLARGGQATSELDEALAALLFDEDDLVVEAAAFALGEREVRGAVDELIVTATSHEDARCRECAVASLGALGDDRARTAILSALNDKAPIRRRAIVALANFEGPEIEAALEAAKLDRDWQVRAAVDQLERSPYDDD